MKLKGEKIGILNQNNEAIFGEPLPEKLPENERVNERNSTDDLPQNFFERFAKVFEVEKCVTYHKTIGLVFAVPLKIDGQNYLLYHSISTETVRKIFSAESYNGSGTVILLNSYHDWMVIADGDELINTEPEMEPNWLALRDKVKSNANSDSWSIYGKYMGKGYFLYVA